MRNVYIGDTAISIDLRRIYEEIYEDMRGMIGLTENEGILEILLFEDYKISNNPFSEVTNFPLNVTFSFEKLIQEEDFVYNIWQINIPFNVIDRIVEEYEDHAPGHEYKILFKDGSQIEIIGNCCWSTINGSSSIFDPETPDEFHTQCDIFNKVHITCELTEKIILINYLKRKIESETNYMEHLTDPKRKIASIERIKEIRNRLGRLDMKD